MAKQKEIEKSEDALVGMHEIAAYLGRGPSTVLHLIRCENLPAIKSKGIWESDKEAVDDWRKERIQQARKRTQ